ncbi:hypothetical protein H5410_061289 [Solanum commersonii]|uniref:Uncharacterized protein n=1 Tax=Solanum commersonii TaxID=4109 RepID=A0A9J5W7A7_SOLCO|nr:hypothetical protein H5410_061289 [Solanum commersonii]
MEELQKVFEVMQLKMLSYDKWKKSRVEGAPIVSWAMFKAFFMGPFFHCELREAKRIPHS